MNVSGTWQGEYVFEETAGGEEGSAVVGHIVAFTMELSQGWLGAVSGKVQDDARMGFPEEGKVKGKFKGTMLEFKRVMPVFRLMHETSRITLETWAERRKVLIDTERPSPPMLFEGEWKEEEGVFSGTWRMNGEIIDVPGSYLKFPVPAVGGTWRMRRKVGDGGDGAK